MAPVRDGTSRRRPSSDGVGLRRGRRRNREPPARRASCTSVGVMGDLRSPIAPGSRPALAEKHSNLPLDSATDARVVSVVVASSRERAILEDCISSLLPQCERQHAELIVARTSGYGDIDSLLRQYPGVRFVSCPPGASIPVARGLGLFAAHGDLVALTEDHCVASDTWLAELTRHAVPGVDVVGGGMDNARTERTIDWAAFISEYGLYASNRRPDVLSASFLTAANVAYTRAHIDAVATWARDGEWENVIHARLSERGAVMRFAPTAVMYQNLTYSFPGFVADRFKHGFDFGRKRVSGRSPAARLAFALGTPMLPLLFAWRLGKTAAPRRWPTFLQALPLTITFLSSWAIGEACGYIVGPE